MSDNPSLLEQGLVGQESAQAFLRNALAENRVSHAYLFLGAPGSGKLDAAYALAQGVVCPNRGCGTCDDCVRAARRSHPDVHLLTPGSATGYLVGQIRELIDDLQMAPIRAKSKVYILDEAERLTSATANALLKNLEEPPDGVLFILLATTRDAVLPTVLSRCQVVPFRPVSPQAALDALSQQLGAPEELCRRALGCCPSPAQAREFLESDSRQAARKAALDCLDRLPRADGLDIINLAKASVAAAKVPLSDFKEAQQAVLDENAKLLSGPAMRELEERQKRELSARERSGIMEQLEAQRSLLRDALAQAAGTPNDPACDDYAQAARTFAARLGTDRLPAALAAVAQAETLVRRNVSPQLAMEAMLFEIKEMLTCRP